MTTLAIDIGGTKLAAALVDKTLNIIERRELPTPASKNPRDLKHSLTELITPLTARARRVAIASTGIINNGVLSAINPQNLGGLAHFPLVETLARLTHLPCMAINDAQAAAWAEFNVLAPDINDMLFVTVSTGVGGGIVSEGKLLTGTGGLAGHIGHTLACPNGPRCGCGRIGCVEAIASGRGIEAAACEDLKGRDAKTIFTKAALGHLQAQELVQRSAKALARLIADLKATTDCQYVVMGGSIGLAAGYLTQVKAYLNEEPEIYRPQLLAAHYQHNAGLLGVALLAQEMMS